ncbi:ras GTPase-activating protein-binding protein 1-like [Teleopsis dalmanni]|uniref:ras GTPase-activating protein-binding protein 1-like n=1 Tax=Teleopsis dalmanni TaxID=139649 RepID=UPI0018CCA4E1|nr:ras GTPase-activating protein-binding protein 1-like [Teleopsis dalmanni]
MVMDATQPQQPSPQSVGREFVRQYYTLLNKAPNHLHRFYNNNSSFIHGESTLVIGQKNIHSRIQQLNFHDCHAKISQVDAQATLGNGVVVQVTGELSNDGQPMRRFTQTFVLAAQSPKKYYVHNDIFRYQDMYSDDDNDGESRSENDDDHEQTVTVTANEPQNQVNAAVVAEQQQTLPAQVVAANTAVIPQQQSQAATPQQQTIYYPMPPTAGRPAAGIVLAAAPQPAAVPMGTPYAPAGTPGVPPPQQLQSTPVNQLNGVMAHDDLLPSIQQQNSAQPTIAAHSGSSPVVQSTNAAPTVITAQTPTGVAAVPVASAAAGAAVLPQNTLQGFQQQSSHMQQQLLQQQQPQALQQQQQQQPILQQQSLLQSQSPQQSGAVSVDIDESLNSNNVNSTISNSEVNVRNTEPAPVVDDFKTINEQQQQEKYEAAKQQQNEPKTYANLFKSTSSSPSGFVNAAFQQQQQLQQQQHQQQQQQSVNNNYQPNSMISIQFSNSNNSMSTYSNRNNDNSSLRSDNNSFGSSSQQGSGPLPQRNNAGRMNKDFEQRRTSNAQQFGDNHQLFLGNIPHHASDEEIKALFERFGTVLELRILSKAGGKLAPGVRNPLNYGFITYEDPSSVQNCLNNCPLYFPENSTSSDRQKLNVEEKKPRSRQNDMPRQGMGNNMNNNNGNSQRNNLGGGPPSRSLSNSAGGGGGMMRNNNSGNNNMQRGGSTGGAPRIGGTFNRNDSRSGPTNNSGGGQQIRGGSNNNAQTVGGSYGGRR